MMPPDQESASSITGNPANIGTKTNRAHESVALQIDQPTSNVINPCVDDQIPHHHQQANAVRASILRQSLRPVTLKVFIQNYVAVYRELELRFFFNHDFILP